MANRDTPGYRCRPTFSHHERIAVADAPAGGTAGRGADLSSHPTACGSIATSTSALAAGGPPSHAQPVRHVAPKQRPGCGWSCASSADLPSDRRPSHPATTPSATLAREAFFSDVFSSAAGTSHPVRRLCLSAFALAPSAADCHAAQAGDFRRVLHATVPTLPGDYPGEQSPTPFIQFGHHTIDGSVVRHQFGIAARPTTSTTIPMDSLALLVCHDGGLKTQMQSRLEKMSLGNWCRRKHRWDVPMGEVLENFSLGMESQRWQIILHWKSVIA